MRIRHPAAGGCGLRRAAYLCQRHTVHAGNLRRLRRYIDLKTNRGYVDDVTPPRQDAAQLLARYSWRKSARALLDILQQQS